MDPEVERSTPTSRWAASQSWWVGDDARSEEGNRNDDDVQPHFQASSSSSSSRRRNEHRRSRLVSTIESENTGEGVPHRDPRSLFGDLPNSSLDPNSLGDPIQRELELRAAGGAGALQQRSPSAPAVATAGRPLTVTFADIVRPYSGGFGDNGTHANGFWRDECGRLQGQIANLARERERWERERRQLQEYEVDRARDLAGLKRAVEAQSQLVMESLVTAQRLAGSGATSAPTRERPTALYDDILQTAWVQPSVPPETARDSQRGEGGGGIPPSWSPPMLARAGVAANWGRREYISDDSVEDRTFDQRLMGSSGAADTAYRPRRSYTSAAVAETAPSRYSTGITAFSQAPQPRQGVTVAAPQASTSRRDSYEPATVTNSNSIINTSNSRASNSSAAVRTTSMEMALEPRTSSWNHRYTLPAGAGETNEISRAPHDQRRTAGWRRISSGCKTESDGSAAGDDTSEGGSEVWEWNGRRVVIRVSPPKQRSAQRSKGDVKATGDRKEATTHEIQADDQVQASAVAATVTATAHEAETASAPIVPHSLLNDIQDIKAMVQALAAGAAGAQAPAPQTGPEPMAATPTVSAPEARGRIEQTPHDHQPKPPDITRSPRSGMASPHTSSPTGRRISLPIAPHTPRESTSPSRGTRSDCDDAPSSDRTGEHNVSERGQAVEQKPQVPHVPESTEGERRNPAPADGPNTLMLSSIGDRDGEDKKERRSPSAPTQDGSEEGGAIGAERGDNHEPLRLDTTGAGEDEGKYKGSTQTIQPIAKSSDSTGAAAEESPSPSSEDSVVGVEGKGSDGGVGLLGEA